MTTRTEVQNNGVRRRSLASPDGLDAVLSMVTGCGCSATPPPVHSDPTVAVIRHVVAEANTFGGGGNPFSRVVIAPKRLNGTNLSSSTKAAINAQLRDLGRIEVSTAKIRDGEAAIRVGAVVQTARGVNIEADLYCGNVCGQSATFTLARGAGGGWRVTGTTGAISVS